MRLALFGTVTHIELGFWHEKEGSPSRRSLRALTEVVVRGTGFRSEQAQIHTGRCPNQAYGVVFPATRVEQGQSFSAKLSETMLPRGLRSTVCPWGRGDHCLHREALMGTMYENDVYALCSWTCFSAKKGF